MRRSSYSFSIPIFLTSASVASILSKTRRIYNLKRLIWLLSVSFFKAGDGYSREITDHVQDYEPEGCNCDNKTEYDRATINAACTQALNLASQGQTLGRDKYPHVYNGNCSLVPINLVKSDPLQDYEKFQFEHAQKPYLEFPILESGAYTDNESPGADRVIIGSISTDYSSAIFCAVITHDGSTKNGFTECKDDTVNTDGKGTWDTEKTQGRGREPGPGRDLLDRIDL
jgi:hypothetical protein